ncbi:response regulator transcription factor [Patescibacteria group bacterium]
MRLLFVNNDAESAVDMCSELTKHYMLDVAHNGEEGTYLSQVNDYAAIVVESDLPDMENTELCKITREEDEDIPIVVLLDEDSLEEKLDSLNCGADAVLTKPINTKELTAYLRNLIKRANGTNGSSVIEVGDLKMDLIKKDVRRGEKEIELTRKEYEVLECLMLSKGRVVSKERLLEQVWEYGFETYSNKLEVHIKSLRDKVDRNYEKKLIKTVYGFGYKLTS